MNDQSCRIKGLIPKVIELICDGETETITNVLEMVRERKLLEYLEEKHKISVSPLIDANKIADDLLNIRAIRVGDHNLKEEDGLLAIIELMVELLD